MAFFLYRVFEGAFVQPVYMCFYGLGVRQEFCPSGSSVRRDSGVPNLPLRHFLSLYNRCLGLVRIASNQLDQFPVRVGGCHLSPILFRTMMDTVSRRHHDIDWIRFRWPQYCISAFFPWSPVGKGWIALSSLGLKYCNLIIFCRNENEKKMYCDHTGRWYVCVCVYVGGICFSFTWWFRSLAN